MNKYYFTYNCDGTQPFYGGWTLVIANNRSNAVNLFGAVHASDTGLAKCAGIYSEEEFLKTSMPKKGNFGNYCHEIIEIKRRVFHGEEYIY